MAVKNEVKEGPLSQNGSEPTEDEIRHRAYEMHLARSGRPGNEVDDWLKAEAELMEARGVFEASVRD
jgi:hypothetical protein